MTPRSSLTLLSALLLAACASVEVAAPPPQGAIAAAPGGVDGYQHGLAGDKFAVGRQPRRFDEHGYFKSVGDGGTLAIRRGNGSAFGVPSAGAAGLHMAPYGKSPQEHDTFVRDYFAALGLPAAQVGAVRGMTLLEAAGRSDEARRSLPKVTAYYTVLERRAGNVAVPDSFAWARANADGSIAHEGVYWPALPPAVVADAGAFAKLLADPQRRNAFQARLPEALRGSAGSLTIHHAGAGEDGFEAFASFDIPTHVSLELGRRPALLAGQRSPTAGATVLRHFDMDGVEHVLPQERTNLQDRYPASKSAAR